MGAALARARRAAPGSTSSESSGSSQSAPVTTTKASVLERRQALVTQPRAVSHREPYSEDTLAILTELLGSARWEEIVPKLRGIAENAGAPPDSYTCVSQDTVEVGDLRIEKHAHRVLVAGSEVALTSLEFRLLVTLVDRRDRVQSRGVLLNDVWELPSSSRTRTVDTHVRRLRDKLGATGQLIHTVRGVGYRFTDRRSIRQAEDRCKALALRASEQQLPSLAG
jgi:DNA-binding response OmpR family regulator